MPSPDPTPNTPSPTEPAPAPDPTDPDPNDPSPNDPSPNDPGQEPDGPTPPGEEAELLADITFMDAPSYETSGTARVVREGDAIRLELAADFITEDGPDLYVWLVKDKDSPEGFFELGRLKSFTGAQSYDVNLINIDDYEAVYIWCKAANALFGSGILEKN